MTIWRRNPDSSALTEPRTLLRVFVGPGELDRTVSFYERLLGVSKDMDMRFPDDDPTNPRAGLRLAAVGGFLVLEGTERALRPFRATVGTLLVAEIEPYLRRLRAEGAEIVHPPVRVPTGAGFTARHPDGAQVEYVQHRPGPHEGGPPEPEPDRGSAQGR